MSDSGVALDAGGPRQRAVLARLLLDADRVVSVERLIDDLWGSELPATAPKMIQIYVSKLRKALPEGVLETRTPGYIIRTEPGELDLRRFEELLAAGRAARAAGDAASASSLLGEGLALWRGPALSDFNAHFVGPEQARLDELRLTCLEERIDADLALGREAELVAELEAMVARNPLRERLRSQLMLALYGSGRQVDALAAYRSFRKTLGEELGIDPSPGLRELEQRMLRQDPGLGAGTVAPATPRSTRTTGRRPAPVAPGEILHARSGDARIAYQVVGEGPPDLVLVHGWVCTFQPGWENPKIASFYERLASMGRLILFDKRGTGLSDRVSLDRLPSLETRMDDVRAVMDAAGSRRAHLLGISEGGPMTALFAATYPQRTANLVLMGTFGRYLKAPDYPIGLDPGVVERSLRATDADDWARVTTTEWLRRIGPEIVDDEDALRWYVSYVIRGASPEANRALRLMNREIDVRHALPAVSAPTLVLYREREVFRDASRALGEQIRGARVVELPGANHLPWEGDQGPLLDEIERFLENVVDDTQLDRQLVTLLATDLGDAAAAAGGAGSAGGILDRHREVVEIQAGQFRGRRVEAGEHAELAVFDGPARAIRCAGAIVEQTRGLGLAASAGLHTGEVEIVQGAVRGIAVDLASRVARQAGPGEIYATHTVRDLVAGSGLEFDEASERSLEGMSGRWRVLRVRTPLTGS